MKTPFAAVPRLAPVKFTVPVTPAPRVRLANVTRADGLLPGDTLTVELPLPRVKAPRFSVNAAVLEPSRTLSVPPFTATGVVLARRAALLVARALLSSLSVPPLLTVTLLVAVRAPLAPPRV